MYLAGNYLGKVGVVDVFSSGYDLNYKKLLPIKDTQVDTFIQRNCRAPVTNDSVSGNYINYSLDT